MRKTLCTNESGAFKDPQLLEQAKLALKSFRGLNLGEDEDRPAKRRRTLPEFGTDESVSAYEYFKSVLVDSDGQSPISTLSNLHNIVQ